MKTKWEWITDRLNELNYPELAELADSINKDLLKLYPRRKHTPEWKSDIKNITSGYKIRDQLLTQLMFIKNEVVDHTHCIACYYDNIHFCKKCEFAKLAGNCGDNGSKFSIFFYKLRNVINDLN